MKFFFSRLVFQQSEKFAKVENQYRLLQTESNEFQGLQSKISLISNKVMYSLIYVVEILPLLRIPFSYFRSKRLSSAFKLLLF